MLICKIKDNKIAEMMAVPAAYEVSKDWIIVPDNWGGAMGDKLDWFDTDMRRIPDADLVKQEKRKDNRGTWFNKNSRETKKIYGLDEEPGQDWIRKAPLEGEPYQKWDQVSESWTIDTEKKEDAEKERSIAEKKAAIEDAEKRIQRSVRAKLEGTATEEDDAYFTQISGEIHTLREALRQLTAA
jgi:hypothetical protein